MVEYIIVIVYECTKNLCQKYISSHHNSIVADEYYQIPSINILQLFFFFSYDHFQNPKTKGPSGAIFKPGQKVTLA